MKEKLKSLFFKAWYWYISTVDKNADVIFMNYGHSKVGEKLKLPEKDEKNRYSVQLYHHVATGIDLKNKSVLEVGCGRGGGLSYIKENLSPKKVTGIDLNSKAIAFCQKHYCPKNSHYLQADAQNLPFEDHSFDTVLNVESSHRYPRPELFFKEVYRVLKPGGHFLFTDFRLSHLVEALEDQLKTSRLQIEKKEDITENVLEALQLATPDREKVIKKLVPGILHPLAKKFAATVGTPTYNKFLTREFVYLTYILKK